MRIIWAFGLTCTLVAAGCEGTGAQAKKTSDFAPGEIRLNSELRHSSQVRIESVTTGEEDVEVRTSGKVGFNEERLSYVSSPLVGRIVDIRAQPGQHVDAGQTLAKIDSPDLGAASSEFIKARADLILAEHNHTLAQQLLAAKAMAAKDFRKAEDELVKAQADLRRARERLVSLGVPEKELDAPLDALHVRSQFDLTAPIAGTVIERNLTLGQMVGGEGAQRLFVIADLGTLWVTADIYEKDLPLIRPNEEVSVRAAAWPQEEFRGHIDYVGDTVDPNSRTVKTRASVDNHELLLKPEMFVTATVRTSSKAAVLTVPLAAVHGEGSAQPYVFIALDDDHFARRAVTLGVKSEDRVAVTSGLSAQDHVVTEGSILLKAEADRHIDS